MTRNNEILTNVTTIEFPVSEEAWKECFEYEEKIRRRKYELL